MIHKYYISVYRTEDGTCWRYYKDDEYVEGRTWSPWYPANIQPSIDHFKAWIISTIKEETP